MGGIYDIEKLHHLAGIFEKFKSTYRLVLGFYNPKIYHLFTSNSKQRVYVKQTGMATENRKEPKFKIKQKYQEMKIKSYVVGTL